MTLSDSQHMLIERAIPFKRRQVLYNEINVQLLEEARDILARIVKIHGDNYLPAFIRIHNELSKRKEDISFKEIALQIATSEVK